MDGIAIFFLVNQELIVDIVNYSEVKALPVVLLFIRAIIHSRTVDKLNTESFQYLFNILVFPY